jgi:hypothetical protein
MIVGRVVKPGGGGLWCDTRRVYGRAPYARSMTINVDRLILPLTALAATPHARELEGADHGDVPFSIILVDAPHGAAVHDGVARGTRRDLGIEALRARAGLHD